MYRYEENEVNNEKDTRECHTEECEKKTLSANMHMQIDSVGMLQQAGRLEQNEKNTKEKPKKKSSILQICLCHIFSFGSPLSFSPLIRPVDR